MPAGRGGRDTRPDQAGAKPTACLGEGSGGVCGNQDPSREGRLGAPASTAARADAVPTAQLKPGGPGFPDQRSGHRGGGMEDPQPPWADSALRAAR